MVGVTLTSNSGGKNTSTEVEATVDTGATFNIIPRHILDRLPGVQEEEESCRDELTPCDTVIWHRVDDLIINLVSKVHLHVRLHGGKANGSIITFRVANPRWLHPDIFLTHDALLSLE